MARIIAIDYGRKRTGLAVTDPMQIVANKLQTVASGETISFLKEYFNKEKVDTIVLGYPKTMDNKPSEAVKYIDPFLRQLKNEFPDKECILVDERFTSKIAFRTMIEGGLGKKKRQDKALIDAISATIILQSYLEFRGFIKNKD